MSIDFTEPNPPPPLTSEAKGFFDRVIVQMKESGELQRYATAKGCPHHNLLKSAGIGEALQTGGTTEYTGDTPYALPTRSHFSQNVSGEKPNARDAALKVHSIREALKVYLPEDLFAEYLEHFVTHLDNPYNQKHLADALRSMHKFIRQSDFDTPPERVTACLEDRTMHRDLVRKAVMNNNDLLALSTYPELVTTIALFQAAHASYIDGLRRALATTPRLDEKEREIALRVAGGDDLDQLSEFVIFPFFMPLVIYAYEHADLAQRLLSKNPSPDTRIDIKSAIKEDFWAIPIDHERMIEAIGTAWDIFFDKDILRADFTSTVGSDGKKVTVLCPANQHLMRAQREATLERIYERVLQPSAAMSELIDDACDAAHEATKAGRGF